MKKRILIVDDEPQIREMLARKLESSYDVTIAANGREAIDNLEKTDFDVVIADILMPEKDGLEVVMYIHRERPETKSIVISSPSNRVFLQSAELLGATRVIEKPFTPSEIEAMIKELLAH